MHGAICLLGACNKGIASRGLSVDSPVRNDGNLNRKRHYEEPKRRSNLFLLGLQIRDCFTWPVWETTKAVQAVMVLRHFLNQIKTRTTVASFGFRLFVFFAAFGLTASGDPFL